mmetsp:Transcript_28378/g.53663  ORF Transcript_28378/g.53663 Transcript_28378/m.53663 type:complete len:297 (-) Transcript_28378:373-1263(-)
MPSPPGGAPPCLQALSVVLRAQQGTLSPRRLHVRQLRHQHHLDDLAREQGLKKINNLVMPRPSRLSQPVHGCAVPPPLPPPQPASPWRGGIGCRRRWRGLVGHVLGLVVVDVGAGGDVLHQNRVPSHVLLGASEQLEAQGHQLFGVVLQQEEGDDGEDPAAPDVHPERGRALRNVRHGPPCVPGVVGVVQHLLPAPVHRQDDGQSHQSHAGKELHSERVHPDEGYCVEAHFSIELIFCEQVNAAYPSEQPTRSVRWKGRQERRMICLVLRATVAILASLDTWSGTVFYDKRSLRNC